MYDMWAEHHHRGLSVSDGNEFARTLTFIFLVEKKKEKRSHCGWE